MSIWGFHNNSAYYMQYLGRYRMGIYTKSRNFHKNTRVMGSTPPCYKSKTNFTNKIVNPHNFIICIKPVSLKLHFSNRKSVFFRLIRLQLNSPSCYCHQINCIKFLISRATNANDTCFCLRDAVKKICTSPHTEFFENAYMGNVLVL